MKKKWTNEREKMKEERREEWDRKLENEDGREKEWERKVEV